jgi:hypothetical protein
MIIGHLIANTEHTQPHSERKRLFGIESSSAVHETGENDIAEAIWFDYLKLDLLDLAEPLKESNQRLVCVLQCLFAEQLGLLCGRKVAIPRMNISRPPFQF